MLKRVTYPYEFRNKKWKCPRCGKWNWAKKIFGDNSFRKKCGCGTRVMIKVVSYPVTEVYHKITDLKVLN